MGYCRNGHTLDDAVAMNPWERQFFPDYNSISSNGSPTLVFDGESLIVQKYGIQKNSSGTCVAVKCKGDTFSIQYQGSNEWHLCSDGKTIKVKGGKYVSGGIKSPNSHEVCTIAANGSSLVVPKNKEGHKRQATSKNEEKTTVASHSTHEEGKSKDELSQTVFSEFTVQPQNGVQVPSAERPGHSETTLSKENAVPKT
ncbi:Peptidase M8 [Trypanosoma melophagium]|uniref:Peptidase M8 n=1 Tax=Trypanosoma melophagium TaxID=715481 RepID=UPI003519ED26|nr:Peptidase M8 [Trypanosoma melophagium]